MSVICKCVHCGYIWNKGSNGSHSCAAVLKISLAAAKDQIRNLKLEVVSNERQVFFEAYGLKLPVADQSYPIYEESDDA